MSFDIELDSLGELTNSELFTEPLRGVLGGRDFTNRGYVNQNNQDKTIYETWKRVLVGLALLTIALPYTFIAGAILVAPTIYSCFASTLLDPNQRALALLANTSESKSLTDQDRIALSEIVEESNFIPVQANEKITDKEFSLIKEQIIDNLQKPTIFLVTGSTTRCVLLIPVLKDIYEKRAVIVSKDLDQTGEHACWTCVLEVDKNDIRKAKIPLGKKPDFDAEIIFLKTAINSRVRFQNDKGQIFLLERL